MMSSASLLDSIGAQADPFNHYNTEFVKLDANHWVEDCERDERGATIVEQRQMGFGLLDSNSDIEMSIDSVNVSNRSHSQCRFNKIFSSQF